MKFHINYSCDSLSVGLRGLFVGRAVLLDAASSSKRGQRLLFEETSDLIHRFNGSYLGSRDAKAACDTKKGPLFWGN